MGSPSPRSRSISASDNGNWVDAASAAQAGRSSSTNGVTPRPLKTGDLRRPVSPATEATGTSVSPAMRRNSAGHRGSRTTWCAFLVVTSASSAFRGGTTDGDSCRVAAYDGGYGNTAGPTRLPLPAAAAPRCGQSHGHWYGP